MTMMMKTMRMISEDDEKEIMEMMVMKEIKVTMKLEERREGVIMITGTQTG